MDVDALHSAASLNPAHLTIRGDVRFNSAKNGRNYSHHFLHI